MSILKPQSLEESYLRLVRPESVWSRLIEIKTRKMEIQDSKIENASLRILIISPPTDIGVKLLVRANAYGESHFLCFSDRIKKIAQKHTLRDHLPNFKIHQANFFKIPFVDNYFDAIFVNCFFDFCQESDFDKANLDLIISELKRALKTGGLLFSVDMGYLTNFVSQLWGLAFKIPFIGFGCHPVDIKPVLLKHNFSLSKALSIRSYGFPIQYVQAIKSV